MTLRRKKELRRSANGIRRKRWMKARNAARRAKEFARAYGSKERVEWIAAHGCLVCGQHPSENAHVITGGMSRKADAWAVVPLCAPHHREIHGVGVETFQRTHYAALRPLSLLEWADQYESEWQERPRQLTPLSAIVPGVVAEIMERAE